MRSDAFRRAAEAKNFAAGAELFSEGVAFKFGDDGLIRELIVMVRPMSGMHALADHMTKLLEAAEASSIPR